MAWFKIDDGFHNHPKIYAVGNAAAGLFVRCGSYCGQHLTDGLVPKAVAQGYGTSAEIRKLLDVGLLVEKGGDYAIPDYLEFNPSKSDVDAMRAEKGRGGQRGNHERWHVKRGITDPECEFCLGAR